MEFILPFRNPIVLALLPVPLLLLFWVWAKRGGGLSLPFDHAIAGRGRWLGALVNLAESIPALLMGNVILILAGPQRFDEPRTQKVLTNIEFCVDVSGSMLAKFGDGDRYDAAMGAINDFLDFREGDAFGLTFFGNSVLHWVPLTSDVSAFRCAPPFMHPGKIPSWFNGTEIGKALLACREVLIKREEGDRMIILVSDGYSWDLNNGRDEEIARKLRDDGIVVYAVHIADSDLPPTVGTITSITGGDSFAPGDKGALKQVFERIDKMGKTRIEKVSSEAIDDYEPWCFSGLILLLSWVVTSFGLRYTPW